MAQEDHPLLPVLNWLFELNIINEDDCVEYQEKGTKWFCDDLRNGYILGKLAMVAVPQNSYRHEFCTNAATSVEKRTNINLFLSACKDRTMRISTSFKEPGHIEKINTEKAWEDLFKILIQFSKRMENNALKTNQRKVVRGFTLSDKSIKMLAQEVVSRQSVYIPGEYQIYGSPYEETPSGPNDIYDMYGRGHAAHLYALYVMSDQSAVKPGLNESIKELCTVESNYCDKFLGVLNKLDEKINKELGQSRRLALGSIVRDLNDRAHFVKEFHDELRNRLESAADIFLDTNTSQSMVYPSDWLSRENICDVFVRMKPRFLVYAPFVEMCNNVDKMIDLMKCDPTVKEDVKNLEDMMMKEMEITNNRKLPTTFNNLLSLPFQHVLRYKLLLTAIGQQIVKTIKNGVNVEYNRHFLKSCENAIEGMHEVNTYINRFTKDAAYKASVRKLTDRITNMRDPHSLVTNYGLLMFDGPMKFKLAVDTKYKENAYLMCFQARILIFDHETDQRESTSLKDKYFYTRSIKVTNGMSLTVTPHKNKKEEIINVTKHENFVVNNRESFMIRVPVGPELDELKEKFQLLIDKASFRPHAKHKLHDFEPVAPRHDINIRNPKPPPHCDECELYLFGQIFTGYKCLQCERYYHEFCFREGKNNPDYSEDLWPWPVEIPVSKPKVKKEGTVASNGLWPDDCLWAANGEDDIETMKADGAPGDFIVYNKPQDRECSVRIAFMKQGSESHSPKAQKVKLKRTENENNGGLGYALDAFGFVKWFDNMPELVDYYKNDPVHPFKRPYFYSGGGVPQPSSSSTTSILNSPILPPKRIRSKSKPRSLEKSDTSSATVTLNQKPEYVSTREARVKKKSLDRRLQKLTIESSKNDSESDSDTEVLKLRKHSDTLPPRTLPNLESPTIYNHPDINSLLEGKSEGSYVIHKDNTTNTESNPYTIHAVKASRRTGGNIVMTAQIYFDTYSQKYRVGKKSYPTLDAFIETNSDTLRFNSKFDRQHYLSPKEIKGTGEFKAFKEEVPYVEDYKKLPYFVGTMDNEKAYRLLLNQPEGTFLLRENQNGELRATIRSNLRDGNSTRPKVGHIPISKAESGTGWIMGQNYYPSIARLVDTQKRIESAFQMRHEYRLNP